jgi:GNAT superfamily N-acetyltransferase
VVRIVAYDPALRDQVLELQRHLWSDDLTLNSAYFEWKYERNPYLKTEFIRLALLDGQVVGMRGLWGTQWEAGSSQRLVVPFAGDLVVAPAHRGRRLALELIEAPMEEVRAAGYGHVFSPSGALATQMTLFIAGWRRAVSLETVHRPASGPTGSRLSVENAPRPDEMAELVQRLGHDGRLRHFRDAQYFAWRFQCPLHSYRFLFWGDGRLDGYLVLQEAGNIVDWEATTPSARAALLDAAIALGGELAIWAVAIPRETRALLQEAGFTSSERGQSIGDAFRTGRDRPQLLVRSLLGDWTMEGCSLLDLNDWDLRMLYSDNF